MGEKWNLSLGWEVDPLLWKDEQSQFFQKKNLNSLPYKNLIICPQMIPYCDHNPKKGILDEPPHYILRFHFMSQCLRIKKQDLEFC